MKITIDRKQFLQKFKKINNITKHNIKTKNKGRNKERKKKKLVSKHLK